MSELPDFGISKDAFCPRCAKTTSIPLPDGWIWDSKEKNHLIEPNARVTNGCKVLAKEPRHGCTIKLFYKEKDGRIRLQPMNPQYSPIFMDYGEDFRVYKVSGKFTKY